MFYTSVWPRLIRLWYPTSTVCSRISEPVGEFLSKCEMQVWQFTLQSGRFTIVPRLPGTRRFPTEHRNPHDFTHAKVWAVRHHRQCQRCLVTILFLRLSRGPSDNLISPSSSWNSSNVQVQFSFGKWHTKLDTNMAAGHEASCALDALKCGSCHIFRNQWSRNRDQVQWIGSKVSHSLAIFKFSVTTHAFTCFTLLCAPALGPNASECCVAGQFKEPRSRYGRLVWQESCLRSFPAMRSPRCLSQRLLHGKSSFDSSSSRSLSQDVKT